MKLPFFSKSKRRGGPRKVRHFKANKHGVAPPETWWKRWIWYLNPKRFRDYWFTREGAIQLAKLAGIWVGIGIAVIAGVFLYFARDLPTPGQINNAILNQTTTF